jgi:hypothetical protein
MENYYYIKCGQKIGPVNKEKLISKVDENTLVWHEGLDDWKKASEFEELEGIYIFKPPPTPKEQKIKNVNKEFFEKTLKQLFWFYIITSFLFGYASYEMAQSSWYRHQNKPDRNRYPYVMPGMNHEIGYANQQNFWFRPFKAYYSTIYLTEEEQGSHTVLLGNLMLSSFASLFFIFVGIGIINYLIVRTGKLKNSEPQNSPKKSFYIYHRGESS